MAAPNIVNVTTIKGKLAVADVTTAATAIVSNSGSSGKVFKLNTIIVSNKRNSGDVGVTTDIYRNSNAYQLINNVVVQTNSSFTPFDKTLALYLEEGDTLRIAANANSAASVVCSYEEIS